MAEQGNTIFIGGRVPPAAKEAIEKAIKAGFAMNESDYVRKAVIKELRKDGLLP